MHLPHPFPLHRTVVAPSRDLAQNPLAARATTLLLIAATWLSIASPAKASLIHRWSMSETSGTTLVDSVGSSNGTIVVQGGAGHSLGSGQVTLDGGDHATSDYVNLGSNLLNGLSEVTIEIWATRESITNWARVFSIGQTSGTANSFYLTFARGTNGNRQRFDYLPEANVDTDFGTSDNQEYHIVAVWKGDGGNEFASGRIEWYRDGVFIAGRDTNTPLSSVNDAVFWLGRPHPTGNDVANASFNEVRIWDEALTPQQIAANTTLGPNNVTGAVAAMNDTVQLNPGADALITVLANDTDGSIDPATVEIVTPPGAGNSATPDSGGRILYEHGGVSPGVDSFTYRVANVFGTFSAPATVDVTITNNARLENMTMQMPDTPPAAGYAPANAFPGLSFDDPICLRTPPGETNRLFVVERDGLIYIIPDVTAPSPSKVLFLDLPALLATRSSPVEHLDTGGEGGLLSIAFHPDYATNRKFYLSYTVLFDSDGTPNSGDEDATRYHRFSEMETQSGNANAADTSTEQALIEQRDERSNHNGGDMHFGPSDGYLYISTGDEGAGNDSLNNSQRMTKDFFASMLRIDVDRLPTNLEPNDHPSIVTDNGMRVSQGGTPYYKVPANNPWAGPGTFVFNGGTYNPDDKDGPANDGLGTVRTEFWAVGLRNPWRWWFNPKNEDLICADVGQAAWEEISILESGDNAGWNIFEGNNQRVSPAPTGMIHKAPVYVYPAGVGSFSGESITGGVVYCGTEIIPLQGLYVFADYVRGNVWTIDLYAPNPASTVERIFGDNNIACFGYDPSNGDVLYGDFNDNQVKRIISVPPGATSFPQTLTSTGAFSHTSMMTPNPGLFCYEPILPFWSDFALKKRWFTVPDVLDTIDFSTDGNWTYPEGMVWVKHFDLEEERGDNTTATKVETRFLVKTADNVYGVSYRWNSAQTEAYLVPDTGVDIDYTIDTDPGPGVNNVMQSWRIPSRAECLACHTKIGGQALSFNTRQLNRNGTADQHCVAGLSTNQIQALDDAGYLTSAPQDTQTLPAHVPLDDTTKSIESRFRSYIAVNCVQCHQSGGPTSANWDANPILKLQDTDLVNGNPNNNGGNILNKILTPGSEALSVLLHRLDPDGVHHTFGEVGSFDRMPNIGSNVLDETGIQLTKDFIAALSSRQFYNDWRLSEFGSDTSPQGEMSVDANNDGETNYFEFLTGQGAFANTNWSDEFSIESGMLRFDVDRIANRRMEIHASTDLTNWTLWDVPDSLQQPATSGSETLMYQLPTFPGTDKFFFRWNIIEP